MTSSFVDQYDVIICWSVWRHILLLILSRYCVTMTSQIHCCCCCIFQPSPCHYDVTDTLLLLLLLFQPSSCHRHRFTVTQLSSMSSRVLLEIKDRTQVPPQTLQPSRPRFIWTLRRPIPYPSVCTPWRVTMTSLIHCSCLFQPSPCHYDVTDNCCCCCLFQPSLCHYDVTDTLLLLLFSSPVTVSLWRHRYTVVAVVYFSRHCVTMTSQIHCCCCCLFQPSPCHYDVTDSLTHSSVQCPVVSCFKSKTGRTFPPKPSNHPGPGFYEPYGGPSPTPQFVPPRHRRYYQASLSAPVVRPDPQPDPPGPGSYDITSTHAPRHPTDQTAAFKSVTTRWSGFNTSSDENVSPATYRPTLDGRRSFVYNNDGRWI